jgi:hypothetical protein
MKLQQPKQQKQNKTQQQMLPMHQNLHRTQSKNWHQLPFTWAGTRQSAVEGGKH